MIDARVPASQRLVPLAVLAASVAALALAYVAEMGYGLEPCRLCLYQRVPYVVAAVLAILALGMPAGSPGRRASIGVAALVFLVGAGIAFYHVGVEERWWASPACAGGLATDATLADLRQVLSRRAPPACDDAAWRLFGVSMAGYNLAASLGLAAGAAWGVWRLMRKDAA